MGTPAKRSVRVDRALFKSAQAAGRKTQRSAAAQLNHWARLGRAVEASPGLTQSLLARMLADDDTPDGGPGPDRAEGDRMTSPEPRRRRGEHGGPGGE